MLDYMKPLATALASLALICILKTAEREHFFSKEEKSWWGFNH